MFGEVLRLVSPGLPLEFDETEGPELPSVEATPENNQEDSEDTFYDADNAESSQRNVNPLEDEPTQAASTLSQEVVVSPKPGFDYLLTSDKAPRDINGDIDESQILNYKRRAAIAVAYFVSDVPKKYRQAMESPEAKQWLAAINDELGAMERLMVWRVVPTPRANCLLGTIWVFCKKSDTQGTFLKFKARLCAQGSRQAAEDCPFTYAPTGRSASLRAAITIGLSKGYAIHQMDAKNMFLNGDLEETVYLRPPAGLKVLEDHCILLKKAIYGLKQAPRVWYSALKAFFTSISFRSSPADPCLFVSQIAGWECFVHVYVDDMIIISHDVDRFKQLISKRFTMEDLGEAKHLLGITLTRQDSHRMYLSQETYTTSILSDYNLEECRTASTPMVANTRLVRATDEEHQEFLQLNVNYRRLIGLLNYLSVSTRPDISFTVSQLSQHLERPGTLHWKAAMHLLRYLSGTLAYGIQLDGKGDMSNLQVYTNADFANCPDDRKSYSGYITLLGGSIISWRSKKQPTVSTSTTEAEYRSLYEGVQESVWFDQLFKSLNHKFAAKYQLYVDNQSAIVLATNPIFQQRTKHIDILYHWLCEVYDTGLFKLNYISTNDMKADMCTKALGKQKHQHITSDLKIQRK
ncbi:hypothetical protein PCASD_01706 [Puccinia coronata f. sp. avenae]|uniref:Reverse transcriptase Ty1/copia-type domain-containing protein n=1 Tax=Puccinia coronata f. sp. avenae TaxID=200324 RepID=A0A2N5VJU1_9BASI|nr:hypothetical protein PCASD_01706 [Puccinia coronata f. sp. avenae]